MADPRFAALASDPRYRLPSRKEARTAVDPRFKRLFTDEDFHRKARVDRYGRKLKSDAGKQELERAYRLDKEAGDDETRGAGKNLGRATGGSASEAGDDGVEVEDDLGVRRDPAREGGFSASSSEEDGSSSEEESEEEAEIAEETAGQEQTEEIPVGEVSQRLAAVNLDWDNVRASDILAVASSFLPDGGRIESVVIYPSEFGRQRLQQEELEGPPREIFASSKNAQDADEDDEDSEAESDDDGKIRKHLQRQQVNEGEEFDSKKLRQYQLERLRYYYAVISCSSKPAAKALYDAMDGREYLSTANFFDLRFVPESTSFQDDAPRDECSNLPIGYQPNEFRTEALTHSRVKLTWDADDATRKEVQKRAFSRAEVDENDMRAYVGSDSSDAESVTSRKSAAEDRKAKRKEAERAKMRAALGLPEASSRPSSTKDGKADVVGDMQITFTSGLSKANGGQDGSGVFENEAVDEESTRQRYLRKERERKQKRKEKMEAAGRGNAAEEDGEADGGAAEEQKDQGFNDPFFMDPSAAAEMDKKARKEDKSKRLKAGRAADPELEARRAELELLMDEDENLKHFDMREIEKAEKAAKRQGKKNKKREVDVGGAANNVTAFQVETTDPRFKALFESHEYAIDPTNPRYKGTEGMKQILEEGRKRKAHHAEDEGANDSAFGSSGKKAKRGKMDDRNDLKGLVARLGGRGKREK